MHKALLDKNISRWISASAGTGKTKSLVDRVLMLIMLKEPFESILAVTFTNLAANEMKERIISSAYKLSNSTDKEIEIKFKEVSGLSYEIELDYDYIRSIYDKLLSSISRFKVQTIHSFCNSILLNYTIEAGLKEGFSIIDNFMMHEIKDDSKSKLLNYIGINKEFQKSIEPILLNISIGQLDVLLNEIINYSDNISYVKKFYGENSGFINALRCFLCSSEELEIFYEENIVKQAIIGLSESKSKTDNDKAELLQKFLETKNEEFLEQAFLTKDGEILARIVTKGFIDKYPDFYEHIISIAEQVYANLNKKKNREIYELTKSLICLSDKYINIYTNAKRERNYIDYNDVINITSNLLKYSEDKEFIAYRISSEIDHILLDEAQDTNPVQWGIILSLLEDFLSGGKHKTLFIVGDEKQSIYGFNGSDVNYYNAVKYYLKERFNAINMELSEHNLTTSYRSTKQVLEMVDAKFNEENIISHITSVEKLVHIPYRNDDGVAEFIENIRLLSKPIYNEEFLGEAKVSTAVYKDVHEERKQVSTTKLSLETEFQKQSIVEVCQNLINQGFKYSDIMILFRSRNIQMKNIIELLDSANIPNTGIDVVDSSNSEEFIMMLRLLKYIANPLDKYNLNLLYLNFQDEELKSLYNFVYGLDLISLVLFLYNDYLSKIHKNDSVLDIMLKIASKLCSIDEMIVYIQNHNIYIKNTALKDAVRIMTVHASKGLEARAVIIAGDLISNNARFNKILWKNDENPMFFYNIASGKKSKELKIIDEKNKGNEYSESLRLTYVAMTRARDNLYISE